MPQLPTFDPLLYLEQKAEREVRERFFNQPSAKADFEHYCKCAHWSLDEAIALSLGKQPTIVNWKSVAHLVHVSAFARAYALRRDIAQRAVVAKQLFDNVHPSIFLSWARQTGIVVVAELTNRAVASGISLQGWKDLYEELAATGKAEIAARTAQHDAEVTALKSLLEQSQALASSLRAKLSETAAQAVQIAPAKLLSTQERENLQLLAFLGAVRGYDYDPSKRTGAVAAIEADTDKLSLRYSDDSIRDHLKAAADFIPQNWRERLCRKPNSGKS